MTEYGGELIPAMQITTGLYPTTSVPLDIREVVADRSKIDSGSPVGCKLYTGLQMYIKDSKEIVTVTGEKDGSDGSRWNHWNYSKILDAFKEDINHCRDQQHGGRYTDIIPYDYSFQNLLNYLYLRGDASIVPYHRLTIYYKSQVGAELYPKTELQLQEGASFSYPSPNITGYTPDHQEISGTMQQTDIEITVTYTANTYYLYYRKQDGTILDTQSCQYGAHIATPPEAPEVQGKIFTNWEYSPSLGQGDTMPADNVYADPHYEDSENVFNIYLSSTGDGNGNVYGSGSYVEGSTVTIEAVHDSQSEFVGWRYFDPYIGEYRYISENSVLTFNVPPYFVSQEYIDEGGRDIELSAEFRKISTFVKIKYNESGRGDYGPEGETLGSVLLNQTRIPSWGVSAVCTIGTTMNLKAIPEQGVIFAGWYRDESEEPVSENPEYSFTVAGEPSISMYGLFKKQITLELNIIREGGADGRVVVTPQKDTYTYDDIVELSANPDTENGSVFYSWIDRQQSGTNYDNPVLTKIGSCNFDIHETVNLFGPTRIIDCTFKKGIMQNIYIRTEHNLDKPVIDRESIVQSSDIIQEIYPDKVYMVEISGTGDDTPVWLAAGIPNDFIHGNTDDTLPRFFYGVSEDGMDEGVVRIEHAAYQIDGVEYVVVQTPVPATNDCKIVFGNTELLEGLSYEQIMSLDKLVRIQK